MIEPCCVVSKLPTVFLLLAALTGFIQANIHRCLRDFDPSNCNALEEVWAFDVRGKKCIEMVYGGCGKPQRFSNRFETHEECMKSCGKVVNGQWTPMDIKMVDDGEHRDEEDDEQDEDPDDDKDYKDYKDDEYEAQFLKRKGKKEAGSEISIPEKTATDVIHGATEQSPKIKEASQPPYSAANRESQITHGTGNRPTLQNRVYKNRQRSLGPMSAIPMAPYGAYPLPNNVLYGPLGNMIPPPMPYRSPGYSQDPGLTWDSYPQFYRSIYNNIPETAMRFGRSVGWQPRHHLEK